MTRFSDFRDAFAAFPAGDAAPAATPAPPGAPPARAGHGPAAAEAILGAGDPAAPPSPQAVRTAETAAETAVPGPMNAAAVAAQDPAPLATPGPAPDTAAGPAPLPAAEAPVTGDLTPADPLYATQWHFALIGDIETVWDEYSGVGVTVYVADEGVEYTHEDLAANYDASMHFTYDGVVYDPMPRFNAGHGTSCAGLIAAEQGNGLGGTGVAWSATITGLDFLNDTQFQPLDVYLASLQWAENFDIMSNSWGVTPSFAYYQSPFDTAPDNLQDDTVAVFETISATGRDGLGTIICQASGNDTRNAQGDAVNGTRFTVSVAATDEGGFATYYTNYGTNILVAAPAAAVTTDLTGFQGYDRGDYTTEFGGTSAATPVTAGVVALMLEANAGLGWRDVHNILAASASQTGTAYGDTPAGTASQYEQGSWFANDATNWNGGGMTFNLTYGYGMVDAFAAVRMAEVWTAMYGVAQDSSNEAHVSASLGAPVALADNATTIATIEVSDDIAIENIQVTLDITHQAAGTVEIWLVSPDGTQFMLYENDGNNRLMTGGFQWIFGVEAARGMDSAGTWGVMVIDEAAGGTGTLDAVTLDFHGSAASAGEVHHVTGDFLALAAVDPGRALFHDDGGHDALDMVAIAGDVAIDMIAGGAATVDGTAWFSFDTAGDVYEDLYLGDGNDIARGNAADNLIEGMRGDDLLAGRRGADTLDGGTGNDVLFGGGQDDLLEGGDGDDLLLGQRGADTLEGGAGQDRLNGGRQDDVLTGGADADTFAFRGNFGDDTITDFTQGEDRIDFGALSEIADFIDLVDNHLGDGLTGAVITALGVSITLEGILAASLLESDFVF